jgi:hypothetical protein
MSADGTWNITTNTPMGAQDATLDLAVDGSTLSGKMVGAQGEIDITGGTADGDHLTWTVALTHPMPIELEFDAMVDGDTISGTAKLGTFGTAPFSGTRA